MPDSNFVKCDDIVKYMTEHVDNYIKKRNFINFAEPYNSASITECDRRLLYRSYGVEVNKNNFGKVSKKYVNDKWESIIEKIPQVKIIQRDVLMANNEINLCAEIDFICEIGDKKVIVNIYESQHDEIERKYIVDIMIKMWISELKHGILIYDKKDDNYSIKHITPYGSIIDAVNNKCKKLEINRINGILTDRPYNNADSEECNLCEYHKICWKGTKWEKDSIQSTQRK